MIGTSTGRGGRGRLGTIVVGLALGLACGPTYVAVRPSEPVAAGAGDVRAEISRLYLTSDARVRGLDADVDLVVELRVRNAGSTPRRLSPGSFSCLMEVDVRRPDETRALLPGGGGEGEFPGEPPGEGSLLSALSVPPGETRAVWAIFHGYRFDDSDVPRRIALRVPVEGAATLELALAEPSRGRLRWETPPVRSAWSVGLRNGATFASGLRANLTSNEIGKVTRSGPVLWDLSLLSTVMVVTQGHRFVSETSAFMGSGFSAHLALPVLSWGGAQNPGQLGPYVGGAAQLLVEIPKSRPADDPTPLHTYGLLQAEAGLEVDFGAVPLAATPFPLVPAERGLPRWFLRFGYQQTWAGGATSAGYVTSLRFVF
jgi:hypothetical protein